LPPIAITAQSKAGGMGVIISCRLGIVNVVCGWVIVMTVEVTGGIVIVVPPPVVVGAGGRCRGEEIG